MPRKEGEISGFIYAARKARGLTQAELANRAGVSPQTISEAETAKRDPDLATIRKLTSVLGDLGVPVATVESQPEGGGEATPMPLADLYADVPREYRTEFLQRTVNLVVELRGRKHGRESPTKEED